MCSLATFPPYICVCVSKSPAEAALNLLILIFLGSELSSVKNNKPSITLTPVINLSLLNSKTLLVAITETTTGDTMLLLTSYSIIASLLSEDTNQYILSFSVSRPTPIHLGLVYPSKTVDAVICELPFDDSTAYAFVDSDVDISTFNASLYSPVGTSLSSRSLFIRPAIKPLFNSGISY